MNKLKLICLKSLTTLTLHARGLAALCLISIATPSHSTDPVPAATSHALVFLVDNSVSMKTANAEQHVPEMLRAYVRSLPDNTRLALVTYDDLATVLTPLSGTMSGDRENLFYATRQLKFSAQSSNIGAGLERALYELETRAGDASARAVVLVHAGTINTGDTEQDQSFKRWTGVVLANKAKDKNIPIYVLSLGNNADQGLSKRLAATTYGAHRHAVSADSGHTGIDVLKSRFLTQIERADEITPAHQQAVDALVAENVRSADTMTGNDSPDAPPVGTLKTLAEINKQIAEFPTGAGISKTSASTTARTGLRKFVLPNLAPKAGHDESENTLPARIASLPEDTGKASLFEENTLRVAGVAILASGIAGLIVFMWRRRSSRERKPGAMPLPEGHDAILTDIYGITGQKRYVITERLARVCRESGKDSLNVVCVTIPDEVISREHAFIEYRDNDYWVTDTGSNNGTFLNGKRIKGSRKLKCGDQLRFATFEFLFEQAVQQVASATRMSGPEDATQVAAGPSVTLPAGHESTDLNGIQNGVRDNEAGASRDESSLSKTLVKIADPEDMHNDETQVRIPPSS